MLLALTCAAVSGPDSRTASAAAGVPEPPPTQAHVVVLTEVPNPYTGDTEREVATYDFAGQIRSSFPLDPNVNAHGVATDPDGLHVWLSWTVGAKSDGLIHEFDPDQGVEINAIPDPTGVGGSGLGALEFDPTTERLWAISNGESSSIFELDPATGDVVKSCATPQPITNATPTLSFAHLTDRAEQLALLVNASNGETVNAIDPNNCSFLESYSLPVSASGLEEDPATGHLIAAGSTNSNEVYDLGVSPFASILGSFQMPYGTIYGPGDEFLNVQVGLASADISLSIAAAPNTYALTVSPGWQSKRVGQSATLTATLVTPDGYPLSGVPLNFAVTGGPNLSAPARCKGRSCTTNEGGQATWGYDGQAAGTDEIRVFADLDGDGIQGEDEPSAIADADWRPPTAKHKVVVSFGDSIAAGEGSGPSGGFPDNPGSYPALLADALDWDSYNFAISGACAATIQHGPGDDDKHCTKSVLSDELPLAASMNLKPDLVTLTVGANDIRFSSCLLPLIDAAASNPCAGAEFKSNLQGLSVNLATILGQIRALYPRTTIIVTRYFDPLPEGSCSAMPAFYIAKTAAADRNFKKIAEDLVLGNLDDDAAAFGQELDVRALGIIGKLNKTLSDVAPKYNAVMVSLDFAGHDFCQGYNGQDDAWVLPPLITAFASAYYKFGPSTAREFNLIPTQRCTPTPACDTTKVDKGFATAQKFGPYTYSYSLIVRSNDFPHLTSDGAAAVADAIRAQLWPAPTGAVS